MSSGSSFLLAVSLGFSLILDPRGVVGGKVRNACEEFEENEGGILGQCF